MVELLSNTKKQSVINGPEDWNDVDLYEIDLYGLRMDDFRDTLKEYEEGAKWVQPTKTIWQPDKIEAQSRAMGGHGIWHRQGLQAKTQLPRPRPDQGRGRGMDAR